MGASVQTWQVASLAPRYRQRAPTIARRGGSWADKAYLLSIFLSPFVLIEPAPTDLIAILAFFMLFFTVVRNASAAWFFMSVCFLFALANIISSAATPLNEPELTLRNLPTRLYMLVIAASAFAFTIRRRENVHRIVTALLYGAFVSFIITFLANLKVIPDWQFFYRDQSLIRLRGTFKDPNVMAPFMAATAMLAIMRLFNPISFRSKVVYTVQAVAYLICILLSGSRGSLLVLGGELLVFVPLLLNQRVLVKRIIPVLSVMLAGAALLGAISFAISLAGTGQHLTNRLEGVNYRDERFLARSQAFEAALTHPLGYGPGAAIHRFASGLDPHNVYAKLIYEAGVAGLLSFCVLQVVPVVVAVRLVSNRNRSREERLLAAAIAGILVSHIGYGWVIDTTHWRHFYLFMGMAVGLPHAGAVTQPRAFWKRRLAPPEVS